MLSHVKRLAGALLVTAVLATAVSAQTIVYSNNPAPGDFYTNTPNQPIGSSGWSYAFVGPQAAIGIRTNLPRNGNGSVWLQSTGINGQADVGRLLPARKLGDLTTLKYDWYRKSGNTVASWLHPVLRLYIDADGDTNTTNDIGYLVFERAYNQGTIPVPTDQWITEDLFSYNGGNGANLWQGVLSGTLAGWQFDAYGNWKPISTWKSGYQPKGGRLGPIYNPNQMGLTFNANSLVIGVSLGIGSGWNGTFEGAVDNLVIGFGGTNPYTLSYNFEVVPEPATMALFGLGLAVVGGLLYRRVA